MNLYVYNSLQSRYVFVVVDTHNALFKIGLNEFIGLWGAIIHFWHT